MIAGAQAASWEPAKLLAPTCLRLWPVSSAGTPLMREHRHGVLSEARDTESQARLPPPYEGEGVGAIHDRLVGNSLVI